MTMQVLLDCDPGIDDALAIALAAGSQDVDLAVMTTVSGNVELDLTTENALKLRDFLSLACPVTAGAPKPLMRAPVLADHVHGVTGLGNAQLPEPNGSLGTAFAPQSIIDTVRASPGQITLVAIGPLTNIALALTQDPGIVDMVADFVIMGGAASVPGNVTPTAEFNIAVDPEAAKIVFEAGWTVTMVGLDVTRQTATGPDELAAMSRFGRLSDELLLPCLKFHGTGPDSVLVHDACAVAAVIQNSILTLARGHVAVETTGRHTAGMTVTDFHADPATHNAQIATAIDADALWSLMADSYARLSTHI